MPTNKMLQDVLRAELGNVEVPLWDLLDIRSCLADIEELIKDDHVRRLLYRQMQRLDELTD